MHRTGPSLRRELRVVGGSYGCLRRRSEYEQAKAKLRCIKIDEVAIAFSPSTCGEVIAKAVHRPLLGV